MFFQLLTPTGKDLACIVLTSLKTRTFSQEVSTGDDNLNEFKKIKIKQLLPS